jgi:general secretion pathway protein K
MKSRDRESGVALLTAIVLVAIAAVVAVAIAFASAMSARRTAATFTTAQGMQLAMGAEAMAAFILKQDLRNTPIDSLDGDWAQPYGPLEIGEGAILEARMEDMEGRFNVNNLIDEHGVVRPPMRAAFEHLLELLDIDRRFVPLLIDWIDADQQPTLPDGGEDGFYLAQSPPYRSANLPITSVTELLALPGMTRAIFDRLEPYIAALPPGTKINVCTARGLVLDALTPGVQQFSLDEQTLATRREQGCFPTPQEYEAAMTPDQYALIGDFITQRSQYFRLYSWVSIGTTRFTLYSLLLRDERGQIRPVLRTFGTD